MPLDVHRLLDSDTMALTSGDEFKAAMTLWLRSWTQVPAASIPSDGRLLARMAGVSVGEWERIAPMALRGWVDCDDGRLYHPVVAEKALQAWAERLGYRERSAKAQAARHDTFVYQPGEFASLKQETALCLERLVPGSALAMGVVLQGGKPAPSRTPSRRLSSSEEKGSGGKVEGQESEGTAKGKALVVSAPPSPTPDLLHALQIFNQTAEELGLPTARKLSEARRKKLVATLAEYGADGWAEAMQHLRASPHCQGKNDRGWKADLDFLLTPSKFLKLIEGSFAGGLSHPSGRPPARSYLDVALDAAA